MTPPARGDLLDDEVARHARGPVTREAAQEHVLAGLGRRGERHRLIGTKEGWGMVAEIWQHTVPDHPSDESDIVRLQDDYRK
mgnify:CR=1 FL=1